MGMLINICAARCIGIEAQKVTVEVDISPGIGIHLVGLADAAVKESLLRTVTALGSMGFRVPGKKIVINLAPADMHKKGSGFDLSIALGILAGSGQVSLPLLGRYLIMGELGLDGSVRPIPGGLPISELARDEGLDGCILPYDSAREAAEFSSIRVYGVKSLMEAIEILGGSIDRSDLLAGSGPRDAACDMRMVDFAEIVGQEGAKRGLEIAAAGAHNVIMVGPPGSGKSTLAKAMAGILPPMSTEEALQTSKIYSVSARPREEGLIRQRPFRSPHVSASVAALIGGGTENVLPGEISLAHNGVLMLDEFCEAPKRIIEVLRAPMEDRKVVISRLKSKVEYPASFMLVAATNPCPCGYYGEGDRCTCSPGRREAYLSKLSGPIMDRIDLHLWLHNVDPHKMVNRDMAKQENSASIAARVLAARQVQAERFASESIFTNSEMDNRLIDRYCPLDSAGREYLEKLMANFGLSARACTRILKIARTIADLDCSPPITLSHLQEASRYRFLDRQTQ